MIAPDRLFSHRSRRSRTPMLLAAGLSCIAVTGGVLQGCGLVGSKRAGGGGNTTTVTPDAFRSADSGAAPALLPEASARPAEDADAKADTQPIRTLAPSGYAVRPGAPATTGGAGAPVETPQLLDAKVGDINGRPVFVSEFLGPLEGRLRAEATRLSRDDWMRAAAELIQQEMRSLITDELLKAEALSRLTVDQKAGLRRFLDDVRRNLLSESRGSQQLAEAKLRTEQGLSQEEYLRQNEDRTLVRYTLQEEIQSRINVSWRDIIQRYARDQKKYNPDPTARFYFLRIAGDDDDARQQIDAAFAAGTPFPDIASEDFNTWTLDEGAFRDVPLGDGGVGALSLFPVEDLNDPAVALRVGESTDAIPFGSSLMWIHLDSIDQDSVSLYDAQLAINQEIMSERTELELKRYIDRLLGRASVSDVDRMMVRLLTIAEERYGPRAAQRRP